MTNPMLCLCNNQALLKAVKRWVGEGRNMTLVGAPDADILRKAIEKLRKRTTAGASTFLVKVKAHRRESANEEADIQADKAISSKDVLMEWHHRTNRAVFIWQEPCQKGCTVSYENRKSTWNTGVQRAIRQGSAEAEVCKHKDRVTGAWKQVSKQTKTTSRCKLWPDYGNRSTTWYMDEEIFQKDLYQGEWKRGRHPPAFLRQMGSQPYTEPRDRMQKRLC